MAAARRGFQVVAVIANYNHRSIAPKASPAAAELCGFCNKPGFFCLGHREGRTTLDTFDR
jgi:hypothetical protein